MRKNFEIIKWMAGQARPFILSFGLIIILDSFSSLCSVGIAILSKNLIDTASMGYKAHMSHTIILFGIIICISIGLEMFLSPISTKTQEKMSNNIRKRIFQHIMRSEWSDFSKYHSGDVGTRLTRDIGILVSILMNVILGVISLIVKFAAAFITLYYYEPMLAISAFALGPTAILFSRIFGHKIKKFHIKMQETEGTYRSFLHESVQNILIIKSFCLEGKNTDHISSIQNGMVDLAFKKGKLSSAANAVLSLGYWIGYFWALGWGTLQLSKEAACFGTLTLFLQLVGQIQGPFIRLAYTYPRIVSAMASAGRLMELEQIRTENIQGNVTSCGTVGIKFSHVSFSYEDGKEVLKDVSFRVPQGETAVLIGLSGQGKTTIVRLILSFIKPGSGSVYFISPKGEEHTASSSDRYMVSYVPQGNTLFSGIIAENLRLGLPDASVADMKAALAGACALEFMEELPEGINTVIGERGLGLSEGQAQRLAIARALLREAPILILDEATSALDIDTEKKVLLAIAGLDPSPTCLVITHRATALQICNHVLKIKDEYLI